MRYEARRRKLNDYIVALISCIASAVSSEHLTLRFYLGPQFVVVFSFIKPRFNRAHFKSRDSRACYGKMLIIRQHRSRTINRSSYKGTLYSDIFANVHCTCGIHSQTRRKIAFMLSQRCWRNKIWQI